METADIIEERKVDALAWYVVRANIKGEDKAETNLRRSGFQTYLPRARREWFDRRRKVWREATYPLMPRYLFVGAPANCNWLKLRACQGVESVLGIGLEPYPIDAVFVAEIEDAERGLEFDSTRAALVARGKAGRTDRETAAMAFKAGKHYRIDNGPLASFTAIVSGIRANGIIEAMVDIFGRLTPVEFDPKQLDPSLDAESEAA